MWNRITVLAIASIAVLTATVSAEDRVFSGPQKGEVAPAFRVLEVVSADKVREVEIEPPAKGASLLVFFHRITEPSIGLAMTLEWFAQKHSAKKLQRNFVLLTDDREKTEQLARRWAGIPLFKASSMSISLDGVEGPGQYGLNRDLMMTVLIVRDGKVTQNFAMKSANGTDAPPLLKAIAQSIDQPVPSYEKIRAEMREERNRRREKRLRENRAFKLAPAPQAGRLMVSLLSGEGVNEARAQRLRKQLQAWAGEDEKKREQLRKYARAVTRAKCCSN